MPCMKTFSYWVWEWAYARTPNLMPRRHMAAGMSMYKGNRSMWVFSWRQSHFDCSLYDHTALLWITFFFWFAKRYPLSVNAIGSRFCLLQALISTGVGKPLRGIKYPLTKSFIESLHVENQKLGRRLIVVNTLLWHTNTNVLQLNVFSDSSNHLVA